MFITDLISVTELSRLTNKSRPTIYKYINDYKNGNLDDIPFSFIELLKMSKYSTREEVVLFCYNTYGQSTEPFDNEIREIVSLLTKNKEKINIKRIKEIILEEIKNDK